MNCAYCSISEAFDNSGKLSEYKKQETNLLDDSNTFNDFISPNKEFTNENIINALNVKREPEKPSKCGHIFHCEECKRFVKKLMLMARNRNCRTEIIVNITLSVIVILLIILLLR